MKKLNEKEMAKVTGGYGNMPSSEIERHKGSQLGKYDLWEGNLYVIKEGSYLMIGRLIESYESDPGIYGNTVHINKLEIISQNENSFNGCNYVGKIHEFRDGTAYFEYID